MAIFCELIACKAPPLTYLDKDSRGKVYRPVLKHLPVEGIGPTNIASQETFNIIYIVEKVIRYRFKQIHTYVIKTMTIFPMTKIREIPTEHPIITPV